MRTFDWYQSHRPWMTRPWTAKTHSVAEKMRLLEHTAQIWTKIDPYYQRKKCSPMTLVSGNIGLRRMCMRIFAGVPLGGGVKWQWGCRRRQFLAIWVAASSEMLKIRPAILHGDYATRCRPIIDSKVNDLEWPWVPISCQNPFLTCKAVARLP